MAKEDIKRYSVDELRRMNERGDFVPTPKDAPVFEGDEEFWSMVERGLAAPPEGLVELQLNPETLAYFGKSGPDYRERMAEILDKAARKAS